MPGERARGGLNKVRVLCPHREKLKCKVTGRAAAARQVTGNNNDDGTGLLRRAGMHSDSGDANPSRRVKAPEALPVARLAERLRPGITDRPGTSANLLLVTAYAPTSPTVARSRTD